MVGYCAPCVRPWVVGGCDVDILCGCCLDLLTPPSGSDSHILFAECTRGGAHIVSGMCSFTIATQRPYGFNRIKELVRVCSVFVLNIFQFP